MARIHKPLLAGVPFFSKDLRSWRGKPCLTPFWAIELFYG
jgi:hypothetical protein